MRKNAKITILIVILAILITTIVKKIYTIEKITESISNIPKFTFYKLNGNPYSSDSLLKGNVIINYFNPDCEHCQYMVTEMLGNKITLLSSKFLMITDADSMSVANFINGFKINKVKSIVILRDTKNRFKQIFGTSTIPSFFIYKNGLLKKKFLGETKIENILNEIE